MQDRRGPGSQRQFRLPHFRDRMGVQLPAQGLCSSALVAGGLPIESLKTISTSLMDASNWRDQKVPMPPTTLREDRRDQTAAATTHTGRRSRFSASNGLP